MQERGASVRSAWRCGGLSEYPLGTRSTGALQQEMKEQKRNEKRQKKLLEKGPQNAVATCGNISARSAEMMRATVL